MRIIKYKYPTHAHNNDWESLLDYALSGFTGTKNGCRVPQEYRKSRKPAMDLREDKDNFYASFELPGVAKKDIEINLENGSMTIKATRKRDEGGEESTIALERSIRLPDDVDTKAVSATYNDGILNVTLPRKEAVKPITIKVS